MGKNQSRPCEASQVLVDPSPKELASQVLVVSNDVQKQEDVIPEQVDQVEVQAPLCVSNAFYSCPRECKTQKYCQTPDDVTNEWLSKALNAMVSSHVKTLCGQGQLGVTVLVTDITYADGNEERPSSVAIKMHTQTEATLPIVQMMNAYSKELFFYTKFAQEVQVEYPKVLGVWTDANGVDLQGGEPVLGFNLMMENLCNEWDGFDPATNPPSLAEFERIILSIRPVHIKFWKSPAIMQKPFTDALTDAGGKLNFREFQKFKPMLAMVPQVWPLVRSTFPKLAGWGSDFPPEFSEFIAFIDRWSADSESCMRLVDVMESVMSSRPMTLTHGDLNCGNVWKNKRNPEEMLFSDWQALSMAPAACDFGTMLIILPEGPSKEETLKLMKMYHDGLPQAMQEEYTLMQLYHDYKMFVVLMTLFISPMMAGQLDPSSMAESKYKFTWTQFWPPIFRRMLQIFNEERLEEFIHQLLEGEHAD